MTEVSAATMAAESHEWRLPYRGKVAVLMVIVTETALFSIFVVAYLYYIGKSLNGPYPKDVLELPVWATICLLSSSLTVVLGERALENNQLGKFKLWWFVTIALATFFLGIHRIGMEGADLRPSSDDQHKSFWQHLLSAGGTARQPRHRWFGSANNRFDFEFAGIRGQTPGTSRTTPFLVLAFCRRSLDCRIHRCVFDRKVKILVFSPPIRNGEMLQLSQSSFMEDKELRISRKQLNCRRLLRGRWYFHSVSRCFLRASLPAWQSLLWA